MNAFGRNLKLSIDRALRDRVRRFYTEGFGCTLDDANPAWDRFVFPSGDSLGAFWIDHEQALADSAWRVAPWLEFLVDDPEATAARLVDLGAERVDFVDRTHPYLRGPGGPVFRLARSS